jgi:hypothetical protein
MYRFCSQLPSSFFVLKQDFYKWMELKGKFLGEAVEERSGG